MRHGLSTPQIGQRLDAVKYHVANTLQKLGVAKRAGLRAWNGVRRDSALHRQAPAMNSKDIALGPVAQVSRGMEDIAAARAWYAGVPGLKHLYSFGNLAFFDCGGLRLFLSEGDGAADSGPYFRVQDIRAAHAALAARGIEFTHARTSSMPTRTVPGNGWRSSRTTMASRWH